MCLECGCTPMCGDYITGTAGERLAGATAVPTEGGRTVAGPYEGEVPVEASPGRLPDGRPASVDETEQAAWGWGLAPARSAEGPEEALPDAVQNPVGFARRQQHSVRRDVGAEVGDWVDYEPRPYAGQVVPPHMDMMPGVDSDGDGDGD